MYRNIGGGNKKQWDVFRHNGPYFPEEYKPHKIPVIINNQSIILPQLAEEYITLYANYLDTDYVKNSKFAQFIEVTILEDSEEGLWVTGIPEEVEIIIQGQGFVEDGQEVITNRI